MKSKLGVIYIAAALFSIHYFIITYLNSTFLLNYFDNVMVSAIYATGAVITIVVFLYINPLLRRIGNNRLFIGASILEVITLLVLALSHSATLIAIVFIIHHALYPILILCLDIYLEHWSERRLIGSVRGLYLITFNACAPLAALASGSLVTQDNFTAAYIISAGFMIALVLLSVFFLKDFKDSDYKQEKRKAIFHVLCSNKKIFAVFSASFLLQSSYTWFVVYVPLYLINTLGMSIRDTTIAIAISLLSFTIFQVPLGKFGDRYRAEKHVIRTGLAILMVGFLFVPFITAPSVVLWAITLFILRTGASFTEIGSESYFFKQIDDTNSQMIEFWRMMDPLAFMTGTVIAGIAVIFLPLPSIFFIIASFLFCGIIIVRNISYDTYEDTDTNALEKVDDIPTYDLSYEYGYKLQSERDLP